MNLIIILLVLFVCLFGAIKLLDGKVKPLEKEQESRLSMWLTIAVALSLIVALISSL